MDAVSHGVAITDSPCHAEFRHASLHRTTRAGSLESPAPRDRHTVRRIPPTCFRWSAKDHETTRFPVQTALAGVAGSLFRGGPLAFARPRTTSRTRRSASPASASAARGTATPTTPASTARSSPSATSTRRPSTRWATKYPNAKKYFDYRKMLEEMGDKIDAVTVSTPDHTHAPASVMAMRMGKHCFCQKPLTWSIEEARAHADPRRREEALPPRWATRGPPTTASAAGVEVIRSGVLGPIKEIHVWTNRPIWPQGIARPKDTPGIPNHVHWDEFLGPAPERPYHPAYHPFNWRGWLDFGTGALGDMACHTINIAAMALELFDPETRRGRRHLGHRRSRDLPGLVDHPDPVRRARRPRPADHDLVRRRRQAPRGQAGLTRSMLHGEKVPGSGLLLVGEKGSFFSQNDYGAEHILLPQRQVQGRREARADPAPLARATSPSGSRRSRRTTRPRRCRTSTTPAG